MKTIKKQRKGKTLIWWYLIIIFSFASCSGYGPDFSGYGDSGVSGFGLEECVPIACEIEEVVESETWSISSFIHYGIDKTSYFEDYNFRIYWFFISAFNLNDENISFLGNWNTGWEPDKKEYLIEDIVVSISFNFNNEFQDLNGVWNFMSFPENKIELYLTNEETDEMDYLTFEKID